MLLDPSIGKVLFLANLLRIQRFLEILLLYSYGMH